VKSNQEKIAALNRIKTLWEEAELGDASAAGRERLSARMDRIARLMRDAEELDAARQAEISGNQPPPASDQVAISPSPQIDELVPSEKEIIDELAARVETAARNSPDAGVAEDFDRVKSRMETVSRIRPSHQDNSQITSPEYAFGEAFSTLIRHVVRQYIDDEFEQVMRQAIQSEITRLKTEADDTRKQTSPKKQKK